MTCCNYDGYDRKDSRKRYIANGAEVNFKSICGVIYDYRWYIEDESKLSNINTNSNESEVK